MKKILGFIFLLLILTIPNSVEAKKGDTAVLNLIKAIKLSPNASLSGTFPIATLNGKRVLCLDLGKNISSGTYTNTGRQAPSYAKKGYNFLLANLAENRQYEQVASQLQAWDKGDIGHFSYAFGELYGNDRAGDEIAYTILGNLKIVSSTGDYCIWEPANPANQSVIAPCDAGSTPGGGGGTPTTCNPTVTIGSCGNASSFQDPTSWSCIAGNAKYKDNSPNQNKYCEIYCQEQIYTSFPGNNFTFSAGQYFTVGNNTWSNNKMWGPVSVSGTRTCKMYYKNGGSYQNGVNYNGWLSDFKKIDSQVKDAYNAWQKENARVNNKTGRTLTTGRCQSGTTPKEVFMSPATCEPGEKLSGGKCYSQGKLKGDAKCPAGTHVNGTGCFKTVDEPVYTRQLANYYKFDGADVLDTNSYCEGESAPGYNATYKQTYDSLVSQRNSLIAMLNNCSTMNTPYTLKPNVSLNYGGDNQYSFNGNLSIDAGTSDSAAPVSTSKPGTDCSGGNCSIYQYNCTGDFKSCTNSKTYVKTIYNVSVSDKITTTTKTANYRLPDGGYRYTDKNTGEVYKTLPSDLNSNNDYIDLKESVLPISIQRLAGSYDIGLNFSNVGNINQGQAHFDKYSPFSGTYSCKYSVKNDALLPPTPGGNNKPHGLNVIYRPISLTTPFPGENGAGRNTGSNWCDGNDCSGTNAVVNRVIINNRNAKSDAVYNSDPLYSIILTPSKIKDIRKYNRTTNYSDFNLTCENGGTGKKCRSDFIQKNNFGFSGRCVGVSENAFNTCANK